MTSPISTEELTRQLNILNTVSNPIYATASIVDVISGTQNALQVSIGGIGDQLAGLTGQLSAGIPTDLVSQLTTTLGGIAQLGALFSGSVPLLSELGGLMVLESFGPPKAGVQPLMKSADDLIDELSAGSRPLLAKLDESMADLLPDLRTEIPPADLANMELVFSNADTTISSIYEKATPALANVSAVTKDIYTDGSVQSIANELQLATGKDLTELKPVLDPLAPPDLTQPIEQLLEKIQSNEFVSVMQNSILTLENSLNNAVGLLVLGGALKGLAEVLTNNIGSVLDSLNIPGANSRDIKNLILAGFIDEAVDRIISLIPVDESIKVLLGYDVPITGKASCLYLIQEIRKLAKTQDHLYIASELEFKADQVVTLITPELSQLSSSVTTMTLQTPSNPNPVWTSNQFVTGQTLNSEEEIIKLFQAVNREVTSIKIIPSGLSLSWATGIATEYANAMFTNYQSILTDFQSDGPAHFFIRSDGTIETMRDLNKPAISASDITGSEYVIEIVYNNAGGRSTVAQTDSLKKLVAAFYKYLPLGEVYASANNSFDINQWIQTNFNKTNIQDPSQSLKYLSKEELIKFKNEASTIAGQQIKDVY